MAQKYFGTNVPISSGFDINSQRPLDPRTVVETYSDLENIPNIQLYPGLEVYVEDEETKYYYNGEIWRKYFNNSNQTIAENGIEMTLYSIAYGGKSDDKLKNIVYGSAVNITEDSIEIPINENKRLTYSPFSLNFHSSCNDIATVTNKGRIFAKNIGKTSVIAEKNGTTDECEVIVPISDLYGNIYYDNFWSSKDLDIASSYDFKEIHIYGKPDNKLRIGQTFPLGAIPYPIDLYNDKQQLPNYCIDWDSSNPDVAQVKYGIIEPLQSGNTTITATIHGTDIKDMIEIEVIDYQRPEERFMHITENYIYNDYKIKGGSSTDTTHAIYGAITEAYRLGYNGVLFDKMDLYVAPIQLYGISIPSNFVVDFGFSSMYMDDWHDYVNGTIADGTAGNAYRFFMGTNSENSVIRNLYYYGETYNTSHKNSDYGEHTLFFSYDNARYFEIYNIFFESVIGFNVAVGYELSIYNRDYHLGNPDGRSNGDIDYTNLAIGKLNNDGSVNYDETGWIYTPQIIPFNHDYYSPYHYIGTNYSAELGQIFSRTRFYDIIFYDSTDNIIEYDQWRTAFSAYKTPGNAVGYRICFPNGGLLPEENSSIRGDYFVQRMMPANPSYCCSMHNCTCGNNFSGILSITGCTKNFIFYNNSVEKNGSINNWSYDIEDCWYSGQQCVTKNNSLPYTISITGVLNAVVDNGYINSIYMKRTESSIFLNNPINYIQYYEDINGVLGCSDKISSKVKNESYNQNGNFNFLEG